MSILWTQKAESGAFFSTVDKIHDPLIIIGKYHDNQQKYTGGRILERSRKTETQKTGSQHIKYKVSDEDSN